MSELPKTIPEVLRWQARLRPDDIALATIGEVSGELSYRAWERRSARASGGLARLGVTQGVRVLLPCGDDWTDFAVAYVATQWAGATAVPVSTRMGTDHLARVATESRAAGIVGGSVIPGWQGWALSLASLEETQVPDRRVSARADDVAEIIYTSGTTGTPKGIAATHANLLWALRHAKDGESHSVMHSLPAGTNAGSTLLLQSLSRVPHTILTVRFEADGFLSAIEERRPSQIVIVPAHAVGMVRASRHRRYDLSSVRGVRNTSAAISPTSLKALSALFPEAIISNMYTSTEAWPARIRTTYEPSRPLSVGRAEGGTGVRIVAGGVEAPHGQVGSVELRMAGVPPRSYDGDAVTNDTVFQRDGWVRTGDLGFLDGDGYLYLEGRADEVINTGGQKVSPLEIDAALEEHPDIEEACTFGVPHPVLGEYVACAIRVCKPVDESELYEWIGARVGPAKAPRRIHIVAEFPRTDSGKVVRARLAAAFAGEEGVGRAALIAAIGEIWADALGLDEKLDGGADFLALGGSSLEAGEVTIAVRRLTGRAVRERAVYNARNLDEYVGEVLRADQLAAEDENPRGIAGKTVGNGQ